MLKFVFLSLLLLLSACARQQSTITETLDSRGVPVHRVVQMRSKDYMELQLGQAAEAANAEYYKAQAEKYKKLDSEDIALVDAVNGLAPDRSPTNVHDREIAHDKQVTERWGLAAKVGTTIVSTAGTVGTTAIVADAVRSVVSTSSENSGVEVSGDNNEVIAGDGNTSTTTTTTTTVPEAEGDEVEEVEEEVVEAEEEVEGVEEVETEIVEPEL